MFLLICLVDFLVTVAVVYLHGEFCNEAYTNNKSTKSFMVYIDPNNEIAILFVTSET